MFSTLWLVSLALTVPPLESGDVVFQTSKSSRSKLIREATGSPFSHVGLVDVSPRGVFVVEAIAPVSRTPWQVWVNRGAGGGVEVRRAVHLSATQRQAVVTEAKRYLGQPYDALYRWDDQRLYCSELVAKAFLRGAALEVGHQQTVASLRLTPALRKTAQRAGLALEQLLLTPASLAADANLQPVYSDFNQ